MSAKTLSARHGLPPRHLETVLQSLVREGVLKGIRGPRGGYELAREPGRVSVSDILRATGTTEEPNEGGGSALLAEVVIPGLAAAESEFGRALDRISLEDLMRRAESRRGGDQTAAQT